MRLIESLKKKKFILFNIFLTLYIGINFIGGERGLVSYFDKKKIYEDLIKKEMSLTVKLNELNNKLSLIQNNDFDFLDMLYREKLKYGVANEIIIKLK